VNKEACSYNGIKVKKVIVIAYTLTGLGSGNSWNPGSLTYFTSAKNPDFGIGRLFLCLAITGWYVLG